MGVMFCMLDQRQSADDHFTIEYVYSHASEAQDEAKVLRDNCASETDSLSTISNSLLKNYLDNLHCLDHL